MAEYLSPAVYIEEKSSGIKPIEGVGTSTAAFVGHAEKGPIGEAVPINNFSEFQKTFGGYIDEFLAFAVKGFFDEGGTTCYVVRTCHYNTGPTAVAASSTTGGFRNGLGTGVSKIRSDAGFAAVLFDGTQDDSAFLISYNGTDKVLTLKKGSSGPEDSVTLALETGETEIVNFSSFGVTIVLDENFDKSSNIDITANTSTGTLINAASIKIVGGSGDISGITGKTLSFDTTDAANITITTAAGGFAYTFDGTSVGSEPITAELTDTDQNTLTVEFEVTGPFAGGDTASIELEELANLVMASNPNLRINAKSPGTWGNDIAFEIQHVDTELFNLTVRYRGNKVEEFEKLTMDKAHEDHAEVKINGVSDYIVVKDKFPASSTVSFADRRPAATSSPQPLSNGLDGLINLNANDYTGDQSLGSGLYAFDKIDGISILAVPDAVDRDVHIGGMTYCENRKDCFYIADSQESIDTADNVLNYKLALGAYSGGNAINSKYGALYTPWISVFDPRNGGRIEIPPSGAVAGIYARTDGTRGVHKVAAGITDGKLRTALDVVKDFTDADQAKLNPKGINVIRKKKGIGNVAWGARTVSSDPEWRYLNVRRLFIFLEKSIENATKWVVFEPNDKALWKSITRNITAFLRIQWRAGALVGSTEEEAFYVKCDEETNPPESIDLGRVITEIGVAPSKPAEFVIFRIAQWQGGSEVSE